MVSFSTDQFSSFDDGEIIIFYFIDRFDIILIQTPRFKVGEEHKKESYNIILIIIHMDSDKINFQLMPCNIFHVSFYIDTWGLRTNF